MESLLFHQFYLFLAIDLGFFSVDAVVELGVAGFEGDILIFQFSKGLFNILYFS